MEIVDKKKDIAEIIDTTCRILRNGGMVVVPSDTVYGLAVDATNSMAVKKLIAFKARPAGKPISVFISSFEDFDRYSNANERQQSTIKSILPGPYTVVLPSTHKLDKRLESEKGTIGLRLIKNDFITSLVATFKKPITATSANVSGSSPHHSVISLFNSLSQKKKEMIDLIIDFGQLPRNKPSTVIDLTEDEITVLRQGDISPVPCYSRGSGNLYLQKQILSQAEDDNLLFKSRIVSFVSKNEEETKKIAQKLIKQWGKNISKKPLVIILQGDLGTGKTQFVKGIGHYYGIENIISPTFVIYYEYKLPNKDLGNLYHVDLYNVSEKNEFDYLGFEEMLKPGNIICIEWGEKSGQIINEIRKRSDVKYVQLNYINEKERKITINY